MIRVKQSATSRAPWAALVAVLLTAATSCGKSPDAGFIGDPGPTTPAVQVAEAVSLTGKVFLRGGRPSRLGQIIDVGGNPFCTGHGDLIDPAWRVAADGGLADVVIAVRPTSRAANVSAAGAGVLVNQKHCEFQPYMTVLQAGQDVRLHNSDLTFHNVRIVRHDLGTRTGGANLDNIGQPSQGDENVRTFAQPGIYRLECDVHRWMKAWVFVHDGIHVASTGADGRFTINRALDDGDIEVEAWHPQFPKKQVKVIPIDGGKGAIEFEFQLAESFDP